MRIGKRRSVTFWMITGMALVLWTAGAGFYLDLFAGTDETYKGLKVFSDVIELLEKNYVEPVDSKDLVQKAIQGMVHSLDPHSQFLPPEAFEELQIETHGEFGGIGIVIAQQKGAITVISPIEGTPAYKAGIAAGDIIIKVDGQSTQDMMLWEAVKKMRGPKGSTVEITLLRKGAAKPLDFQLIRDIIPIESVKSVALKPGYGYIWVTNFRDSTTDDLKAALEKLEKAEPPLKGLVLDLRDNPGGLLNQAVEVADLFLESGTVVSIQGRQKRHDKEFKARPNDVKRDYPMVVLINAGSASASEIVAGALQDHKRALILGNTSFGKGSVQTVETLRDGYGLKFTIARYYTPNGRSIQAQGIVPDIEVKYRPLEEDETAQAAVPLKEKDLRNHLEAEPEKIQNPEPGPQESEPTEDPEKKEKPGKPGPRKMESRHAALSLETLQTDNQVMRALEILVGYDIFRSLQR